MDLQKTLTSGIILMELSLRGKHFFLKMFVLDYLQLGIINHDVSRSTEVRGEYEMGSG